MMLDCDTTVTGYNKFQLLVVEWLFSLISFAAISSVKGYSARSPLVYAMLIGLFIWLISMVLGVLLLMGWRDKLNPRLERLYYGVFTILCFVAFICAASVTLGAGPIKAAAAFLFFNTGLIGYSAYLTHMEITENTGGQFSGILPTVGPSMASQEGGYSQPSI